VTNWRPRGSGIGSILEGGFNDYAANAGTVEGNFARMVAAQNIWSWGSDTYGWRFVNIDAALKARGDALQLSTTRC
jgi:hypothetical protein